MTSARSVALARSVRSAWSVAVILFFIIDFKGFTVATNYKNHRRWFEKVTGVALILCACRRPPHPTNKNDITNNCNVGSIGTVGSIGKVGSSLSLMFSIGTVVRTKKHRTHPQPTSLQPSSAAGGREAIRIYGYLLLLASITCFYYSLLL